MSDQVQVSREHYLRLVRENNQMRELVYGIATTAPYGKHYREAVYATRKIIIHLGLQGYWETDLQENQ
jgi:hypothetical protein